MKQRKSSFRSVARAGALVAFASLAAFHGEPAAGDQAPPPILQVPWDGHGGVFVSQQGLTSWRVITVGYNFGTPNAYDKSTIAAAVAEAFSPLPNQDGSMNQFGNSMNDIIIINGGTYSEPTLSLASWVHLVPDGDVTIQANNTATASSVIQVSPVAGTDQSGGPRLVRIGGADLIATTTGTFTLLPHTNSSGVVDATDQRGIVCLTSGSSVGLLDIIDTTFTGFRANRPGAAIYFNQSRNIVNCTFTDCVAQGDGGAVMGKETGTPAGAVVDCTFQDCKALGTGHDGGGVYGIAEVRAWDPTAAGCSFTGCQADANGGAVATATIVEHTTIDSCTAGLAGGGLHNVSSRIGDANGTNSQERVTQACTIQHCVADEGGGIAASDATVRGCSIDLNEATVVGGGGLYDVSGDIDRCLIRCNYASGTGGTNGRGGGLNACNGIITNCSILQNAADDHGGGMSNCDGAIKHNDIINNWSGNLGGGLRGCGGAIRNNVILDNSDEEGGASSNALNSCSDPSYCVLPTGWAGGGTHNKLKVAADCKFVAYTIDTSPFGWDLHIQSGSICIDNGNDQTTITRDMDFAPRPGSGGASGAWDIGADEF